MPSPPLLWAAEALCFQLVCLSVRAEALSDWLPVSEFMNQYMSNFIHRQVIENNKQKAIYNKHRNIIDMLDYRAVTDVWLCVAYKINRN